MPGSQTTQGQADARITAPAHFAFRQGNNVGTLIDNDFAAQWLAYTLPYRRFADTLAEACARLGAGVDRYSFTVMDLHHLLLAGLPAHSLALRPAHSRGHQFVTRYPKASDISSPPCLLRLLPAGAVAGWGLHPLESAALSRRTPTAAVCSGLQKRLSPLVPAAAPSRNSAGARMAASRRSKLPRNAKKPIQSGASVGRRRSRALFARGDGLVQQCSDFMASDVARPTTLAPSVAHFVCMCSKEFPFQGVKQRR
jgi:hypothetical protein